MKKLAFGLTGFKRFCEVGMTYVLTGMRLFRDNDCTFVNERQSSNAVLILDLTSRNYLTEVPNSLNKRAMRPWIAHLRMDFLSLFIYWGFTPLSTLFQLYHGDS